MNEQDKIEDLKKNLYSRKSGDVIAKHMRFRPHQDDVETDWQYPSDETPLEEESPEMLYRQESSSFFRNILWAAVIFFLLALGFAFYILYGGKNVISVDNVNILVAGPVSVAGGDTLPLDIKVENNNNVPLELVDLSVEFPDGTVDPTDVTQPMPRYRQLLGTIAPHDSSQKTVKAVFYGEENSKKELKITAEYRVAGSNAVYYKEKAYDIFISSTPVNMTVTALKEVNANQDTDLTVDISSNSTETIHNVLVKADYPFGFAFKSSDPSPAFDNDVWNIGDLPAGAKKTITLHGTMKGQTDEERVFQFSVGTQNPNDKKTVGTVFVSSQTPIQVKKPFLSLNLTLNGDSATGPYAVQMGSTIKADLAWTNNTPADVINGVIKLKLTGSVLDKTSVSPDSGFYSSTDDTITWDQTNTPELATTHSGQGGHVSFSFVPQAPSFVGTTGLRDPEILISVAASGKRVSETGVPEQIDSAVTRNIRVASDLALASRIVRSVGPFSNTGPFPAKADTESTYTIIWTVANTSSTIGNAQVKETLPS